jgi:hypothetical protein
MLRRTAVTARRRTYIQIGGNLKSGFRGDKLAKLVPDSEKIREELDLSKGSRFLNLNEICLSRGWMQLTLTKSSSSVACSTRRRFLFA